LIICGMEYLSASNLFATARQFPEAVKYKIFMAGLYFLFPL
jgi:hypothetical protein